MHISGTTSARSFAKHWSLRPGIRFLNHGSFGACPKVVLERQAELRREMEAEPVQFLWRHYDDRLEGSRMALAKFLGARARDLVFVTNATTAVNAVVRSQRFRTGDEILTTSFDYNACRNVLQESAMQSGARLVVAAVPFPLRSPQDITAAVMSAVTPKTRFAMIDHVSSETAIVLPVADITRELESRGIPTLVDGAHAPGMLPLNLQKMPASWYTGNLHKWVCAPKGAAFLWARENAQSFLQPAVISHGHNRPRPKFSAFQDRFDWAGTFDPTPWFCVPDALEFMGNLLPGGWPEIRRHNHSLACDARNLLCKRLDLDKPCPNSMLGSMATLPLPSRIQHRTSSGKIDADQLRLYDAFNIEIPLMRRPDGSRWFRLSAQIYLSLADFEALAAAIQEL